MQPEKKKKKKREKKNGEGVASNAQREKGHFLSKEERSRKVNIPQKKKRGGMD